MASITPIFARQNTEQTTTSTTYVSANCATGALANGVDYLVIYRSSFAANSVSDVVGAQLVLGTTTLAECLSEGSTTDFWEGDQCTGFCRVTGNGSDALDFEFKADPGGGTANIGALMIIAVPTDQLVENTNFWESGTNSGTNEQSGVPTDPTWTNVRQLNFTAPQTGDYLVLSSIEAAPANSGGSSSEAARVRWTLDGSDLWGTGDTGNSQKEWEDDADWHGYSFCGVVNMAAGSRTIGVDGMSRGAATSNYRRSRIWVFDTSAFDQVAQDQDTAGATTTSLTMVDRQTLNYTPNQTEDVVILSASYVGANASADSAIMQLDIGGTPGNINAGVNMNDGGFDANSDNPTLMLCEVDLARAAAVDYKTQFRTNDIFVTVSAARNRSNSAGSFGNLIAWSMTLAEEPDAGVHTMMVGTLL